MDRRLFILSASASLIAISSQTSAESRDLILTGIELVVLDVQCSSGRPELASLVSLSQTAAVAVGGMQEEFKRTGSKKMVVARPDLPPVDAQFPPLSELYATVRVDLDYSELKPSSAVGAVGLLLRHVEYGTRLFSAPWTFFEAEVNQKGLETAINLAVSQQVRSLANVLAQSR